MRAVALFLPGEKNGAKTGQPFNIVRSVVGEANLNHKADQPSLAQTMTYRNGETLVTANKTLII